MADLDAEYVNVQYSANLTLLNENCLLKRCPMRIFWDM